MGDNGLAISPDQIGLDSKSLPYTWQVLVVQETPEEKRRRPGVHSLPEHIEIRFRTTEARTWKHGDPVVYIIPLDAYQKLWQDNGSPTVTRTIERFHELIASFPDQPPSTKYPAHIPALPDEQTLGQANDIAVHLAPTLAPDNSNPPAAKQRGYRFIGRWADEATGYLLTRQFVLEGSRLVINCSSEPKPYQDEMMGIQVAIVEAPDLEHNFDRQNDKAIPGYTLDDCDRIITNQLEKRVSWRGNSDLSALRGRPVYLRFRMKKAGLFSFQITP